MIFVDSGKFVAWNRLRAKRAKGVDRAALSPAGPRGHVSRKKQSFYVIYVGALSLDPDGRFTGHRFGLGATKKISSD
jgi:hypothetical protein